ncbi:MAG TPA: hypothetical protein PKY60_15420, partial [Thermoflexales bacterium]|nr:hypothetical protein [Thermoflexales bacterium]
SCGNFRFCHQRAGHLQNRAQFQFPRAEILDFAGHDSGGGECGGEFQFPRAEILDFALDRAHPLSRGLVFQFPRAEILDFARLSRNFVFCQF